MLRDAPYLRNLAALVLLGTAGATLVDYVFKVQAVAAFGRGDALLRFFAVYYAATSLLTFVDSDLVEPRRAREARPRGDRRHAVAGAARHRHRRACSRPASQSVALARGGESVFRGSLFRSGYELFYTPIPPAEKRAAKSIIDVGFDRLGDAVGGGIIRVLIVLLPPVQQAPAILDRRDRLFASPRSSSRRRLNRGYIQTLERSLLNRAVELDLGDVEDVTTRTVMLRHACCSADRHVPATPSRATRRVTGPPSEATAAPGALPTRRSREIVGAAVARPRARARRALRDDEGCPRTLVPHVIPLLAWDPVARGGDRRAAARSPKSASAS